MDEPVASPSSTRMTVRCWTSMGDLSSRYSHSLRSSSCCSLDAAASMVCWEIPSASTTSRFTRSIPPDASAPIASSSCPGTPSFLTTKTSSGACSAFATSYPTGTPPRGKARTTTSSRFRNSPSLEASKRPASKRSANSMALLLRRLAPPSFCRSP